MHRFTRLTELPLTLPLTLLLALAPGCGGTSSDTDASSAVDGGIDDGAAGGGAVDAGAVDAGDVAVTDASVQSFRVTVTTSGTGTGRVTSSPVGIDCGASCEATFPASTTVTLTATPSLGSTFDGWTGGGCTGTDPCVVDLGADTTVTASFSLERYTLEIERDGTGDGTVTSSPAGIECGDTCSASFDFGTVVTLTAEPDSSSELAGYSGGGCGASEVCEVTITGPTSVTATFTTTRTVTAGNATDLGSSQGFAANSLLGPRVTVSSAGTLLAFGVIARDSDTRIRFALYTDEAGAPGTLVAQTDPAGTPLVVGSQEIAPTDAGVALPAGTYWLMAVYDRVPEIATDTSGETLIRYVSFPFGAAMPTTFPTSLEYRGARFNYWIRYR